MESGMAERAERPASSERADGPNGPNGPNGAERALVIAVARSKSMAVRHAASRVSVLSRCAARSGLALRDFRACADSGHAAATEEIRAYCADAFFGKHF